MDGRTRHNDTGQNSPLGTYTKSTTPRRNPNPSPVGRAGLFTELIAAAAELPRALTQRGQRLERWALQSVVRDITPSDRTAGCLRRRVAGASHVAVKWSAHRAKASYGNLQVCGRVWKCPICASKISEHRRKELVTLVERHTEEGKALLVTRTFPHKASHQLGELQAKLSKAEVLFRSGEPWKRLVKRFGIVGTVRAVETTLGVNGWHPHIHEIILVSGDVNHAEMKAAVLERWQSACTRAGLDLPSEEHGVDVRDGEHAARYASKWGIESELTKWHIKKSKGGLSPFDLLRIALHSDDPRQVKAARALWEEYALATAGKRQLVWSKGLRDAYNIGQELTDEEAAEGEEPDAQVLGMLTIGQWSAICKANKRGELLEAVNASGGEWESVAEVLGEALHTSAASDIKTSGDSRRSDLVARGHTISEVDHCRNAVEVEGETLASVRVPPDGVSDWTKLVASRHLGDDFGSSKASRLMLDITRLIVVEDRQRLSKLTE